MPPATTHVRKLLLTLFTADDVRTFLSDHEDYATMTSAVVWGSSRQEQARQITVQLENRGYLDDTLFDRLVEARPGQEEAIRTTQTAVMGGGGSASTNSRDDSPAAHANGDARKPIIVLFWAANPVDIHPPNPLRLDKEVRAIDERIQETRYRDHVKLETRWAVRYSDLSKDLLRYRPQIVHFSGHGDPEGRMVFEDSDGDSHDVDVDALAELFRVVGDGVRCVVLNACYSAEQAIALAAYVDCVVGTTRTIEDPSAIVFAAGFYRALGSGLNVRDAFDLGRNEVDLGRLKDSDVLQLHTKEGIDAADVTLVGV